MALLCTTCDRRQTCLPALLSQQDDNMLNLLQKLKTCDLKSAAPASAERKPVLQTLRRWFTQFA